MKFMIFKLHDFFILSGVAISLATCTLAAAEARADIAVVVNPKNEAILDMDQIKNIFLGKKKEFSTALSAKPIDQAEDKAIRTEFYLKLAGKDEGEMKVYWSNLIFTGYGTPPKSVAGDLEVKKLVSENPNAIGYIDSKFVDSSVRSIYVIK